MLYFIIVHIPDRAVPPRAIAVLPTILRMHRDVIYPRRNLPMHVRFGPIKGKQMYSSVFKVLSSGTCLLKELVAVTIDYNQSGMLKKETKHYIFFSINCNISGICTKICLAEADEIIFESVLNNKPILFVNREEHCVTYVDVSDKG